MGCNFGDLLQNQLLLFYVRNLAEVYVHHISDILLMWFYILNRISGAVKKACSGGMYQFWSHLALDSGHSTESDEKGIFIPNPTAPKKALNINLLIIVPPIIENSTFYLFMLAQQFTVCVIYG